MHVHDCIVSVFRSGWFGKNKKEFLLQPPSAPAECAKHGIFFKAHQPSVCGSDTILTVFREMRDNRAVRVYDSGTLRHGRNGSVRVLPTRTTKILKDLKVSGALVTVF
jgi:hypothetical protein